MRDPLQFLAWLTTTIWWGGLTVYAGIVVPIGTRVFGTTDQGFVTQQVTNRLNLLATVALVLSTRFVFCGRRRWLTGIWVVVAATLIALVAVHWRLDAMLDAETLSVVDDDRFYAIHRVYLWLTTAQWVAGLLLLIGLVVGQPTPLPTGSED